MKVLSFNSGRGGAVAAVDAAKGQLLFSYESEKGSFPKSASATVDTFVDGALWFDELPEVVAMSGNAMTGIENASSSGAGYFGVGCGSETVEQKNFFGRSVTFYSSTHVRAHLWSAYGLSPYPQGQPCYVLIWDDVLGDFFEIDGELNIRHIGRVLDYPCHRFARAYEASGHTVEVSPTGVDGRLGRMMMAASLGDPGDADPGAVAFAERLLDPGQSACAGDACSGAAHLDTARFNAFAAYLSEALFERFHTYARQHLAKGYPLLIAGDGALNCVWTTRWREVSHFPDVFVAPAANDAGCAIGTAVDAMRHVTGRAKLDWSVYAGQPFEDDASGVPDLAGAECNLPQIAAALAEGQVIGWARGSCEIGPRSLGNRSILAAPFEGATRDRINRIKSRPENYPVAPVCLEEDVSTHFDWHGPSPHMLQVQKVTDTCLAAVTHSDGSARVQTVSRAQNQLLYDLLVEFKRATGVGVLCNTSLNFPGAGFVNKTSDLVQFAHAAGLDGVLAGIRFYRLN